MPTSADLDRLEALVTRLTPLTETAPGELIRAEDWNLVVGALIEVARAAIAEGRPDGVVPPHEHPDQVAPGWLTPGLRDLLERGPLADPAAAGKLGDLERRLGRLNDVADGIGGDITSMRASVSEVATRDLQREASVTQIRRVVEGIGDARDDVATLRGTLRSLEDSVKVAVDVSGRLTIDGQPVDMEAVGARLQAIEAVRDRLTLPNGNLLDATAFEKRLTDLQGTLVTEQELDEALKNRPGKLDPDQVGGIKEELRATLGADLDTRLQIARTELRGELDQRFASVGDLVTSKIGEAVPAISEGVLTQARSELTTGLAAFRDETTSLLDQRLGKLDTDLRAQIDARAQELRDVVPQTAKALIEDALPPQLQPLLSRLDQLDTRTAALDERQQGLQAGLTNLSATVQDVSFTQNDGFRAVRQEMDAKILEERRRVDTRFDDIETRMPTRFGELLNEQLGPAVDERVTAAVDQAAPELETRMTSIAADAAGDVEERIVKRTDELVGERVDTAAGQLREQLNSQLATELQRMPKRVLTDVSDDLLKIIDRRIDERVLR